MCVIVVILAHDESILKLFPAYQTLLFKTGFTAEIVETCTSLCVHGMNVYKIETFINERRLNTYAAQHTGRHGSV